MIGFLSIASAEPFTAEVPFNYTKSGGTLTQNTDDYKKFEMYAEWKSDEKFMEDNNPYHLDISTNDGCLEGYDRDIETDECKLTEVIAAEALADCKADLTCPSGNFRLDNGTTINYDELITHDPVQSVQVEEIPDDAFYCGYDISLYQDGSQFETPVVVWTDEDGQNHVQIYVDKSLKSINLKNYPAISKERMAAQACLAQWELEKREAIDVRTTVPNDEDYFVYHAQVASGIPAIGQDRVNNDANKDHQNTPLRNLICNGYYTIEYKKSFGCKYDFPVGDLSKVPTVENVIPLDMGARIEQFNNDGGYHMALELYASKKAEKLLALQTTLGGQQ